MNKQVALGLDIGQRLVSLFIANALPIVTGGALLGVDVAKSAGMAGLTAVFTTVQRLAKMSIDGDLTTAEVKAAFEPDNGVRAVAEPASAKKSATKKSK
jgi:hypothetical protein